MYIRRLVKLQKTYFLLTKYNIMKNIIIIILLSICTCACKNERPPRERVESLKAIVAKTIETENATALSSGKTKYILAFHDGWTERTSFGFYSCLRVGDTVRFTKLVNESDYWFRMEPLCE
jgi:hypothetical protein